MIESLVRARSAMARIPEYGMAPEGYTPQRVAFVLVLSPDGDLLRCERTEKRCSMLLPGDGAAIAAFDPRFLWGGSGYLTGAREPDPRKADKREKTDAEDARRMALHLKMLESLDSGCPGVRAVVAHLRKWTPGPMADGTHPPQGYGVFRVEGCDVPVHDMPGARADWERLRALAAAAEKDAAPCSVLGIPLPQARLAFPIKGVAGGMPVKKLISFNTESAESHGMEQTANARMSKAAAQNMAEALNAMLDGPLRDRHAFRADGMTVCVWADGPQPAVPWLVDMLAAGYPSAFGLEPERAAALDAAHAALEEGRWPGEPPEAVHVLALTAHQARIAVRLHLRLSPDEIVRGILAHGEAAGLDGLPLAFPHMHPMLRAACRQKGDAAPEPFAASLLPALLAGARYPDELRRRALAVVRDGGDVSAGALHLVKGHLNRNEGAGMTKGLDDGRTEPAYLLGRVFALVERVQALALPDLNRTVKDCFYASAMTTPAMVFPRLFRVHTHHLRKLRPGGRVYFQKLLDGIYGGVSAMPRRLDQHGQSLFTIGYHHQRQALFAPRAEADEAAEE